MRLLVRLEGELRQEQHRRHGTRRVALLRRHQPHGLHRGARARELERLVLPRYGDRVRVRVRVRVGVRVRVTCPGMATQPL